MGQMTQPLMFMMMMILHISSGFSKEVFHTDYNYITTILQLYYMPYEISCSVHYGCMVVKIQVLQILHLGGAR
jgi:hypothetical protein